MNETQKKSKKFLIIYCIAIFTCAVTLILLASLSQERLAREADEIKGKLESAELLATNNKTRLDAVMTENTRLNERLSALTEENKTLTEYRDTAEKRIAALTMFNEILHLKLEGKRAAFNTAVNTFNESGYFAYLSAENQKIFNSLVKGK